MKFRVKAALNFSDRHLRVSGDMQDRRPKEVSHCLPAQIIDVSSSGVDLSESEGNLRPSQPQI